MTKVLISAYACEPGRGSEPAIGWNWVKQAARFHQVWVLTQGRNRPAIEAELQQNPVPNLQFVYYGLPKAERILKRTLAGRFLYALLWQFTAIPLCRRLHHQVRFEVAHHVTFVSYHYPSCLAWLPCPFVWGPVGGCLRAPLGFYPSFGVRGMTRELLRDVGNLALPLSPWLLWTMWRAKYIVPTTEASKRVLPRWAQAKSLVVRAEGIYLSDAPAPREQRGPNQELGILYVGRLIHWKGAHLAIRAFAEFLQTHPDAYLTVHMDGPERPRLERLAASLGLGSKIEFDTHSPFSAVNQMYDRHDILLCPSMHDSGNFVVLEAMSRCLPVVCVDLGGPAHSVTGAVGIKVQPRTPKQTVHDLAAALGRLANDPQLRSRMGEAGRRRVAEEFDWNSRGDFLRDLYPAVASNLQPDFKKVRNQA